MAKIRTDAGQIATVQVRIPEGVYRKLREIAIRHDVTLAQAMDFLFDEIRIEAEETARELEAKVKKLQAELKRVKAERDKYKKEIEEAERVLSKRARPKAK